jgi:hypothetical protein
MPTIATPRNGAKMETTRLLLWRNSKRGKTAKNERFAYETVVGGNGRLPHRVLWPPFIAVPSESVKLDQSLMV